MTNHLISKSIAYLTLGCKVNSYETEAIRQIFRGYGATEAEFTENADVYLINTCTVTNIADRKSRQMLHRARKNNPNAVVIATGCYVQEFFRNHEEDDLADIYVGNRRKSEIAAILNTYYDAKERGETPERFYVNEDSALGNYENMNSVTAEEHIRAYMKIQDGCNQFCSYCIIPFARGRIASRKEEDILAEAESLAKSGYKEIVITGIHLSSFGLETKSLREQSELRASDGSMPLIDILKKLSEIPGIERIRLGSLEPRIVTDEFTKALSEIPKICPHFHLSLQSGCDKTLRAMNRKYTTQEFAACADLLRKYFVNPALTTDIIVGFPGETGEDFAESVAFAEAIGFAQIHVFPFSRRMGTVADRMKEQLTEAVKKERADRLIKTAERLKEAYYRAFLGQEEQILVETVTGQDGKLWAKGHTSRYGCYRFPVASDVSGEMVSAVGTDITTDCTIQAKMVDILHKIE